MEYRRVGNSGLRVSEIGLGNWLTHGGSIDNEAAVACVHAALDEDITFFDTADIYNKGRAETVLGDALKDQRREDLVVATKCFWPMSDNPNDEGLSRKHIIESCNNSLKRLKMDYVDLYQAHRYDDEVPLRETLRAYDDLVRSGKVHYVGVSEWTANQISDARAIADDMGFDRIDLEPAAVLDAVARPGSRSHASVPQGGPGPGRVVAAGDGSAYREVRAGQAAARGYAWGTGAGPQQALPERRDADRGSEAPTDRGRRSASRCRRSRSRGCCRTTTSPRRSSARLARSR